MKGIYLIAIATVFLASGDVITAEEENLDKIPTVCPAEDPEDSTIHLAHESDPTKFYMCRAGKKILRECPKYNKNGDKLCYDPSIQVCDWPWRAGCKHEVPVEDQAQVEKVQFIVENEKNKKCEIPKQCPVTDPDPPIYLPHETDCTKYYKCSMGKKFLKQCPKMNNKGDRLHFNPCIQLCDWPWTFKSVKWPLNNECMYKNSDEDQVQVEKEQVVLEQEYKKKPCKDKIPTKCPIKDSKNFTVHLAHEDCTKFYKCHAGRKVEMKCPKMNKKGDRLHFNACLQVCDWPEAAGCQDYDDSGEDCMKQPWNAKCKDKNSDEDQVQVEKEQVVLEQEYKKKPCKDKIPTKCPIKDSKNFTVHLAHEDCTKFYKCDAGRKVEMKCPKMNKKGDRLHFNACLQVCDWPEAAGCQDYDDSGEDCMKQPWNAKCKDKNSDEDQVQVEKEQVVLEQEYKKKPCKDKIPTKCPIKDSKNFTVHLAHEDCTKFYKCHAGRKVEMKCPKMDKKNRLHFNACLQVCDWPWDAGCQDYDDSGEDCMKQPWDAKCKDKNSDEDQVQVEKEQIVLEQEYKKKPCKDKIPTKCPIKDPKNTTIHLAHEDCTKFYMCHAGRKIEMKCPKMNKKGDKLHFNACLQVCDWPWDAGCQDDSDEDRAAETNEELISKESHKRVARMVSARSECPDKNPGNTTILVPHEYDCTKFYMCLGSVKVARDCPYMNDKGDRLHFNSRSQVCDWPDQAGCKDEDFDDDDDNEIINEPPIPDEEDHGSAEIPTKCPAKDPTDTTIHLAHEYDCTKFYKCHAGKKILKQCPKMNEEGDRLHFNPRLQVCDWPWQAGCQSSSYEPTDPTRHTSHTRSTHPTWHTRSTEHTRSTHPTWHTRSTEHTRSTHPTKHTRSTEHTTSTHPTWHTRSTEHTRSTYPTRHTRSTEHTRSTHPTWHTRSTEHTRSTHPTRHTRSTEHTRSTHPTRHTRSTEHTTSTHPTWHTRSTEHTRSTHPTRHTHSTEHTRSTHPTRHTQSTHPTRPTRPPPTDECFWDDDGLLLPHQCNCSMFYECMEGNKVLRECPDDLYFSKKYQGCVKIEDSDCKRKEPPPKCTREGELIPHECDCTKYYKCREDDKVLRRCEDGFHFSPKHRKCESPDKAGCEEHPPGPGDCPKPEPKHPWRHECDCRLFYKCENGKKRLYECPWGYYYDTKKDGCRPQENVTDCKNSWDD